MPAVSLIVYSDYLCPWCYNATVRLRRLEDELAGAVRIDWRSYLLRPNADRRRTLEQFRAYTRTWMRPAAEPDAGTFREWQGDAGPPSHSIPPHVAAKAAASLGPDAFHALHDRLLHAYFAESRDITDDATLRAVWREAGLPAGELVRLDDPRWLDAVVAEHEEALRLGVNGVPAARLAGNDAFITGAYPVEMYRRWIERAS